MVRCCGQPVMPCVRTVSVRVATLRARYSFPHSFSTSQVPHLCITAIPSGTSITCIHFEQPILSSGSHHDPTIMPRSSGHFPTSRRRTLPPAKQTKSTIVCFTNSPTIVAATAHNVISRTTISLSIASVIPLRPRH